MKEINKRLVEVNEVLKNLDSISYSKLPKELLNLIEQNKDSTYEWKYDSSKQLSEQNLPHDTICILSYINSKYFLNDKQKEYFINLHKINSNKKEEEKIKKYNPDLLFHKEELHVNTDTSQEKALIKQKTGKLKKILDFFKKFLRIK